MNTKNKMELIGIYNVKESSEVFLVEMRFAARPEDVDVSGITQELKNTSRDNWQAAYAEKYLDHSGEKIIGDDYSLPKNQEQTRIVFFFHYLDFTTKLLTPFGEIAPTPPLEMPQRLANIISYE